jgi:hypothetical protein
MVRSVCSRRPRWCANTTEARHQPHPSSAKTKGPVDARRAYRRAHSAPIPRAQTLPELRPDQTVGRLLNHRSGTLTLLWGPPPDGRAAGQPPADRGDAAADRPASGGVGRAAGPGRRSPPGCQPRRGGWWHRWLSGRVAGHGACRWWTRLRRVLLRWQASQPTDGRRARSASRPLIPLAFPLAFPPPPMAGATDPRSPAFVQLSAPSGGQSAAKTAADWPPSGEWCGRAERCASRD